MSRLVFASAISRLHADLIIVRLKHAGIATPAISVIYPLSSRPNSTRCWLGRTSQLALPHQKIAVSGFLRSALKSAKAETLHGKLSQIGLPDDQSAGVEETLLENRVIVAIEAEEKFHLPTTLRVLQRTGAEKIVVTHSSFDAEGTRHGSPGRELTSASFAAAAA